jgi:hypothetical protein
VRRQRGSLRQKRKRARVAVFRQTPFTLTPSENSNRQRCDSFRTVLKTLSWESVAVEGKGECDVKSFRARQKRKWCCRY